MMADATTTATPTQPPMLSPQEMTSDQLRKWELTGEAPPREPTKESAKELETKADQPAEAAAAQPGDQAVSKPETSKEAAPGTAKPEKTKAPGQKLSAKERSEAVDRENAELQEKLRLRKALRDELKAYDLPAKGETKKAADPSSAKVGADVQPWKKYLDLPGAPKAEQFADVDEYTAAVGYFIADKIAEEKFTALWDSRSQEAAGADARDREFIELAEAAETGMQAELETDPEILDRIPDQWKALNPSDRLAEGERLSPAHFVKDQVMFHSRHRLALSELICADNYKELTRIARMRPDQIIREVARLDAMLGTTDSQETAREAKPASTVSKAPAPATTLGRKAAPGVDPLTKAIQENDFDTFNRLETEREIAARR